MFVEIRNGPRILQAGGRMEDTHLVMQAGVWAPVICDRVQERDYLRALCLMLGMDRQECFLIAGEHTNLDTPPTYLSIPHL